MPAPTTTGANMGYPSTVDTGGIMPAIFSDDAAALVGPATTTLVANTLYMRVITVYTTTIIVAAGWRTGTTTTGKTNIGIYTVAGNLVAGSDTGQVTNVTVSDNKFTYGTPVTLAPGVYFVALAASVNTDNYVTRGLTAATIDSSYRAATNALSAGALPATTGTILTINLAPTSTLFVQGGVA